MEISIINPANRRVVVLFNGGTYVFYSEYYGTLAIANRSDLAHEYGREFFTLRAGNRHCEGGVLTNSRIIEFAKRFINKSENKYISKSVEYETQPADLADIQPATLAE